MNRFHTLDYLRGLAAFGIMIYHYYAWTLGVPSPNSFLGKFGLYGVSIFYVLSGLTLFLVYFKQMDSLNSVTSFFIKRVYRIMPLLWLVIFLTYLVKSSLPQLNYIFFLNVTGLFGIIDCNISIARGGWSIGNEIVFYLFFPFFVILSKWHRVGFYILSSVVFMIFLWFAFFHIDTNNTIEKEWYKYINPLNQIFLFLGGYLLGYLWDGKVISKWVNLIVIAASLIIFTFLPSENHINLITDYNRIIFSTICIVICFSTYKLQVNMPKLVHNILSKLGESSYSVYLLHPIVFAFFVRVAKSFSKHYTVLPAWSIVAISIPCTLLASYTIYQSFEKYFIKKGKELSVKWNLNNRVQNAGSNTIT